MLLAWINQDDSSSSWQRLQLAALAMSTIATDRILYTNIEYMLSIRQLVAQWQRACPKTKKSAVQASAMTFCCDESELFTYIQLLQFILASSQRTLPMLVGVVALRYQHCATHVLCGVDNGAPQFPQTQSESLTKQHHATEARPIGSKMHSRNNKQTICFFE